MQWAGTPAPVPCNPLVNSLMASRTVRAAHAVSAADVASRLLRQRLGTVARVVAAVATGKPRAETVHRLRISARRAAAAITAFRSFVPRRQRRWFKKSLRRIRRAAGEARDLDVLTARCRAVVAARPSAAGRAARKHLLEMLAKKRPPTRRELEDEITNLLARDWNGQAAALLAAVESAATTETIVSFARRRSRRLARRFLAHLDDRFRDDREIHRLRVHTKKLRYSLELFTAAAPTAEVTACIRELRRLQTRLGEFTDHAAAAERLRLWSQGEADDRARRTLVDASRQESALAKRARRGCIRWWTASRRDTLARQLKRILRGTVA